MGYELHIHRRANWTDDGDDIGLEEWREICKNDPSLSMTGYVEDAAPGGSIFRYENAGLAIWTPPKQGLARFFGKAQPEVPFDFRRGSIIVKSPTEPIIAKMCEIAALLNARVEGDDGEFYH